MVLNVQGLVEMNIIAIIPARMSASRFPGKPMAKINGVPMIGHVYERTKKCRELSEVYVATCDLEIKEYIESIGGKAVMTADTHERASERASEAMTKIEAATGKRVDIVVMVQGDEPMVVPQMISEAIRPLQEDASLQVVNLMAPLEGREEQDDPNEVKVVVDPNNYAIYFSREAIPSRKKFKGEVPVKKQVCIIPFRRDFLIKFNQLKSTPLEIIESVDMMRVIEHGYKVKMVPSPYDTYSVDTPEDLEYVASLMKKEEAGALK